MIELIDIQKSFDNKSIHFGVSFNILKGRLIALIGGSGSGKSVLLKMIAGLLQPDRGTIKVKGLDISSLKGNSLRTLRSSMGYLFQNGALFDSMTVFENVAFPLREKLKIGETVIEERVYKELDNVGLSGSEMKYPSQISGGMIKRAALARSLIMEPDIMLFDEPTTGLDPVIGLSVLKLIEECHSRLSFTGIIVTHEIPRAFDIVSRVIMLKDGRVYKDAAPKEFMDSDDPYIKAFMGRSRTDETQEYL